MKRTTLKLFLFIILMGLAPAYAMEDAEWDVTIAPRAYRIEIYPKKGAYEQNKGLSNLDSGNVGKGPIIQTYLPDVHAHYPEPTTLFMHIPLSYTSKLPFPILQELAHDKVDSDAVKILVVGQSVPWKTHEQHYGFYPQYGTDPLAPNRGAYFAIRNPKIRVLYSDSQQVKLCYIDRKESPQVLDIKNEETYAMSTVSSVQSVIHPACTGDHHKPCVHTGGCVQVVSPQPVGLSGLDPERGESLWSVVSYNDGYNNRAIVTLHLLFNWDQLKDLRNLMTKKRNPLSQVDETRDLGTIHLIDLLKEAKELPGFKDRGGHFIKLLNILETKDELPPLKPSTLSVTIKNPTLLQDWYRFGLLKTNPIPVKPGKKLTVTATFSPATETTAIGFLNSAQNTYYDGGVIVQPGQTSVSFSSIVPVNETQTWLIIRNLAFNGSTDLPLGINFTTWSIKTE
ncbi:MAG: hypothetical protein HYX35_01660 [Proteobacteria bacterium]|nr:hypothetical protein [Pseudomonadota bacterium]